MNSTPPGDPIPLSHPATLTPAQSVSLSSLPSPSTLPMPPQTDSSAIEGSNSIKNSHMNIPPKPRVSLPPHIQCRGSYSLGTACGKCSSCLDEWHSLFDPTYLSAVVPGLPSSESVSPMPEAHTPENKKSCPHLPIHKLSSGHLFCTSCLQWSDDGLLWGRYDELPSQREIVAEKTPSPAIDPPHAENNPVRVKTSHTPGPWKASTGYEGVVVSPDRREHICTVHFRHTRESRQANAQLIAAAPEMLTGLDIAIKALRSYEFGNSSPELAKEVADHLQTVIAKAEGAA